MHPCIILGFMLFLWQHAFRFALVAIALLLIFGFVLGRIGERRDRRLHPAPGRMVSVGDHRLHLLCKGGLESAGPTVVIEQGAGELASSWWPMQDEVAKFARVCTYDRAGYGWSEPVAGSRTVEDRALELHLLLKNADVPGPYVFVAHSYGGLIVRDYFRELPAEVAGLVLVDTPAETSIFQSDVLSFYAKARMMNRVVGLAARFGVLRVLRLWLPLARYGFWLSGPAEYSALCDDLLSVEKVPASKRVPEKPGSLGATPLIVISHGLAFPGPFAVLEKNWIEGQRQLTELSSEGVLVVAAKSNHMVQHDEPELVLDAIRRVCAAAVNAAPLVQQGTISK